MTVIFTNEKLENYRDYLSEDRWQPYAVSPDGDLAEMIYNYESKYYQYTPIKKENNKGPVSKPEPTFTSLEDFEQKWKEEILRQETDK
jgi:hypothetical protein